MALTNMPKNDALSSGPAIDALTSTLNIFQNLQKEFFKQAEDKNVKISATGKTIKPYASLKGEEQRIEKAFYIRQEAARILDNPKGPSQIPANVNVTQAEIQTAVDTMKAGREHLAKESNKLSRGNAFTPPKPGN